MRKFATLSYASLGFLAQAAGADTIVLNLNSTAQFDRVHSTGIWNNVTGQITGAVAPSGTHANRLDFGDASDGAFSDGAFVAGVTVSGTTVTINTTTKAEYNFSSFNLSAGSTLAVTGTRPLTIRVHGNTTLAGTITANGGNGTVNSGTAQIFGGNGVAGGGNGGRSGAATGTAGDPGTAALLSAGGNPSDGGLQGINASFDVAESGGGGGCNGQGPDGANDATFSINTDGATHGIPGNCVSTRTAIAGNFESLFTGGAGGGGGGAQVAPAITPISGASGGGGGGAIRFVSLGPITVTGVLEAKGGAGGNNSTLNAPSNTTCGGAGGGGAGGSIWFQTSGLLSGAGQINLSAGTFGVASAGPCAGNDGGQGSRGVYRADTSSAVYAGPTQSPASIATAVQVKTPASQTYLIYSQPIDLTASYITLAIPTETLGCGTQTTDGTLTVTYEGSNDSVTWDKSVSGTGIAELSDYPYIRIKVAIATNGAGATPPCLTGLSIPYELKDMPEITLKGGFFCGRVSDREPPIDPGQGLAALVTDLALLLIAVSAARWRTIAH